MLLVQLAFRNLFRNGRRTFLTCLLITSSLVVMILMDGLILGMLGVMVGGITQTLEGEAQIYKSGFRDRFDSTLYLASPKSILTVLEEDETLTAYAPRVVVPAVIGSSYNTLGGMVYGVDPKKEIATSRLRQALVEGEYLSDNPRGLLMGRLMAEKLEIGIGDRVVLTASAVDNNELVQGLFRVSGIIEFGPKELDESFVFIPIGAAQALFHLGDGLHQIALRFKDFKDANRSDLALAREIQEEGVEFKGWLALQPSVGAMLEMTSYATLIIGVVLFLFASLGVINSIFMSIYERLYELAIAKAIGTRPAFIGGLILLEAFALAVISCGIGLPIAFCLMTYFTANGLPLGGTMEFSGVVLPGRLYPELVWYQFVQFPLYVILLTVVAAIYPALFAARIAPARSLQKAL